VRISDSLCPFCGEALPLSYQNAGPAPVPTTRLGRAAKFAFGAAVAGAIAVTGCGDDGGTGDTGVADTGAGDTGTVDDGGGDATVDSGPMPLYGGPPVDGGPDGTAGDADVDSGAMALYGGPPADAGGDGGAMLDDGGAVPLYGAPPEA
jgi:hypothetical protein